MCIVDLQESQIFIQALFLKHAMYSNAVSISPCTWSATAATTTRIASIAMRPIQPRLEDFRRIKRAQLSFLGV